MRYLRWWLAKKMLGRNANPTEIPLGVLQALVIEMLKDIAKRTEQPVVDVIENLLEAAREAQEEMDREVFGD